MPPRSVPVGVGAAGAGRHDVGGQIVPDDPDLDRCRSLQAQYADPPRGVVDASR
jgi:hypothetical protein